MVGVGGERAGAELVIAGEAAAGGVELAEEAGRRLSSSAYDMRRFSDSFINRAVARGGSRR